MKILTWNCNQGISDDFSAIKDFDADVVIIQECEKLGIPIVSMLDTNCDPDVVDIPIPANDDAIRSIKLIVGKLADAIYEGRHGQLEVEEDYDDYADEDYEYDEGDGPESEGEE